MVLLGKIQSRHPRAESLRIRGRLAEGFRSSLVVPEGLAAHGRGEAFDYILGERTTKEALRAIDAGVAMLLLAERPVISVNGNAAALVPEELVKLAKATCAKLEVNLFHSSKKREAATARWLKKHGAREVLGTEEKFSAKIEEIRSDRRKVDRRGIAAADVVLIPLEDGDRTQALRRIGKRVIAIDLNPMSRTALTANVTIVDNITRAMPLMIKAAKRLPRGPLELLRIVEGFNNAENLKASLKAMIERLKTLKSTQSF